MSDCGCCSGTTVSTPADVLDRPGLSAIVYRAGIHDEFKRSMLARLSSSLLPALGGLKTRDDDDFSIVLLDAFAMLGDVLTFYQERIRNEAYLRTATERHSVLELARLIGYELRPGIAANTFLSFQLETGAGAPGFAKIQKGTKVQSLPGPGELPQTYETIEDLDARAEWNAIRPKQTIDQKANSLPLRLTGVANNLKIGDALLVTSGKTNQAVFRIKTIQLDRDAGQTLITPDTKLSNWKSPRIFAFRARASLFGSAAPNWQALPTSVQDAYLPDPKVNPRPADWPPPKSPLSSLVLDASYPQIAADSWIVLSGAGAPVIDIVQDSTETAAANYTLSAKVTQVTLASQSITIGSFSVQRGVAIYAQSEELTLAAAPDPSSIQGNTFDLDTPQPNLKSGQFAILTGTTGQGEQTGEPIAFKNVSTAGGVTTVVLTGPLSNSYVRTTVVINANCAHATHGESKKEVLGGGDAGASFQRFQLKNAPLTYLSAQTATGSQSTLEVRVNDLKWTETPYFFGHSANQRIYTTRLDDNANTTITFGDGQTGSRVPTGRENITVTYRQGSGLSGMVKANQLSLLMTRPLGVKSVTNPLPPTGAADRERLSDARANAPLTVLTFERVVSLQDYEDYARAFPGIAKSQATWFWDGQVQGVFVTVAGPNGATIIPTEKTYVNLLAAMRTFGDPRVHLRIGSYVPALFEVSADLSVDEIFDGDAVVQDVEAALRQSFAFEARAFGQPVALSEVIDVIQHVPGVVAAYLTALHRSDSTSPLLQPILAASAANPGASLPSAGSELLTLDPGPVSINIRDRVPAGGRPA